MVWLSYRTAARLLRISILEVGLLRRCGYLTGDKYSVALPKNAWDDAKYMLRLKSVTPTGW